MHLSVELSSRLAACPVRSSATDKMEEGLLVLYLGLSVTPTSWKYFCRRP